jgi:hypothetical protein
MVKAVSTGRFPAPDRHPDEPHDKQQAGHDPQEMCREPDTEENQNYQERQ